MSVRTVLITGANQGLGIHTVHRLASTPNVLVFMGSRKLAAAEEALSKFVGDVDASSKVVPVQLDVTDSTSIKNVHAFIDNYLKEKSISGVDVLINNAGSEGSIEEAYAVNVFGAAALVETIRPLLNNGGAIINISSGLGSLAAFTQRPAPMIHLAYNSSKTALNSLTLQWAIQEEEKGSKIRVVAICPGFNATSMTQYAAGAMSPADGCAIIVKTALEKEGRSGVFFNKDGDVAW